MDISRTFKTVATHFKNKNKGWDYLALLIDKVNRRLKLNLPYFNAVWVSLLRNTDFKFIQLKAACDLFCYEVDLFFHILNIHGNK